MARIALVVPCFNEAQRLDKDAFLRAHLERDQLELVFVDDGSRDDTRRVLEDICRGRPNARLVAYDRNEGKAEAVRRGVNDALSRAPDAIGFWDADLATPLSTLPAFVAVLASWPSIDVVIGSRVQLMGRSIERRAWRHYTGRLFATATSFLLDLPIYDTQCGAKLFRTTPLLREVFASPFAVRWIFDVEIIARYLTLDPSGPEHAAQSLYELPLDRWVDVRGSKVKATDFARAGVDLAILSARYGSRIRRRSSPE